MKYKIGDRVKLLRDCQNSYDNELVKGDIGTIKKIECDMVRVVSKKGMTNINKKGVELVPQTLRGLIE